MSSIKQSFFNNLLLMMFGLVSLGMFEIVFGFIFSEKFNEMSNLEQTVIVLSQYVLPVGYVSILLKIFGKSVWQKLRRTSSGNLILSFGIALLVGTCSIPIGIITEMLPKEIAGIYVLMVVGALGSLPKILKVKKR